MCSFVYPSQPALHAHNHRNTHGANTKHDTTPAGTVLQVNPIIAALSSALFPAPRCESQVDLCFVIDSSGSIRDNNVPGGPDNWQLQLEFLVSLVRAFTVGRDATRVGAVVFSEQVRLAFALDRYNTAEDISAAILAIQYLGQTTNTPEALRVTRTQCFNVANGDRPNVPNLVLIVTDGQPFPRDRRGPALVEARALKDTGVTSIAIGITSDIDVDFLRELSSSPQLEGQNFFTATDFAVLNTIQRTVVEGTCTTLTGKDYRCVFGSPVLFLHVAVLSAFFLVAEGGLVLNRDLDE